MNMKQKLLLALVASILATPAAFATYDGNVDENTGTNDDAVDYQNVTVNVPEVALIDISATTGPSFVFSAPVNAGDSQAVPAANTASKLKYSSNVAAGKARSIAVSIDSASELAELPANMVLTINDAGVTGGNRTDCVLTGSVWSGCTAGKLITSIQNFATGATGNTITYTPSIKSGETMIGHTGDAAKTLKLVYTLSTES